MTLLPAPDDPGSLYKRLISEDGKIEMGIYPVMYGYRIRAGRIEEKEGHALYYELDWCGGDDLKQIQLLYTICRTILSKRETNNPWQGLPGSSMVKPFWKDAEFTAIITEAAGELLPIISLTETDLIQFKISAFDWAMNLPREEIKEENESKKEKKTEDEESAWR